MNDYTAFANSLDHFGVNVRSRLDGVARRAAELALESIKFGSPITRAPGQPVRTGTLRASFQLVHERGTRFRIFSKVRYAWAVEQRKRKRRAFGFKKVGPAPRSLVGGAGSVRLTRRGFKKLVQFAALGVVQKNQRAPRSSR